MGIEPMTSSLPRKRSTPELRRLIVFKGKSPKIGTINSRNSILLLVNLSGWPGSNRRPTAWKAVALPTELHPLKIYKNTWGEKDSNLRRHKSTDLQSVPVGHFGIPPKNTLPHGIPMKLTAYQWKGLQNYTDFLFIPIFDLKYLKILLSPVKIIFLKRSS